ncbi:protein of unknown function [Candidatus Methylomirabilis oxygeniifera]|uniref:Uncharacterized protein n=1 Tax=Methylomirabilis oxygeniifera TaxID=671143 RepID=D5MHY1_METO1|nr:protein of unknown function [Candidatus Methylomirabilis oxyfera]
MFDPMARYQNHQAISVQPSGIPGWLTGCVLVVGAFFIRNQQEYDRTAIIPVQEFSSGSVPRMTIPCAGGAGPGY